MKAPGMKKVESETEAAVFKFVGCGKLMLTFCFDLN